MSRYSRHNPEEAIRHEWITGGTRTKAGGSFAPAPLLARTMNLKSLSKQIEAIKTDGTAGQQIFVNTLAKECRNETPRPVCPQCFEPMVRMAVNRDASGTRAGGEVRGWLCKC